VDAGAREALRLLGPDAAGWVPETDGVEHDVCIVGGGQSGVTLAYALRRAGIDRVSVIDAAPDEDAAGIWRTVARMQKLRTPKALTGPELGIPALGFQAWYEARHGAEAYAAIDRILRTDWADYLRWLRGMLGVPVRYGTRLLGIEPAGEGHFRLQLQTADGAVAETARKVVLANGFAGSGGPYVPPAVAALPRDRYAHTAEAIDFSGLEGREVAVVGGAASAFDAAAAALEAGARSVDLYVRRAEIASVAAIRARGYAGAYDNYASLPDAVRWRQALRYRDAGSTPPQDSIERAMRFPGFRLHLAAPWEQARMEDGRVHARAGGRDVGCDFVIAGTGYFVDAAARAETAAFASEILLWRDRYAPPPGQEDAALGASPYLGLGHEYLEKTPGRAPFLRHIHVFNPAAFLSFGLPVGDVPSMRRDVPGVVARISRDLFLADLDWHEQRMTKAVKPDFPPDLYRTVVV
jgi:cation diffusion facilitator CzcD-associated flavoprotein CzcO